METAAKDKADASRFKEEYDAKLKNVDVESEEILSEARKKALKKESDIVNEAKGEANRILDRANREVELEKNKVKDEVKQEMITVAAAMAGKIVAASLDEEKQSQLVADTLKEMGDETWLS
jgi:F-type H+-transporting ATPase subunit b